MSDAEYRLDLQNTIQRIEKGEIESRRLQIIYLILQNTPEHHIHNLNGVTGNKVFVHIDGHSEAVFDKDGKLVKDGVNDGSYNYFDGTRHPLKHFAFDIHPWIIWGNSSKDKTSKEERIYGYVCDLEIGIRKALDAKESLKEIKKENWDKDGQLQALAIFILIQKEARTTSLFSLFERDISSITDQNIFDALKNLAIGFNKVYSSSRLRIPYVSDGFHPPKNEALYSKADLAIKTTDPTQTKLVVFNASNRLLFDTYGSGRINIEIDGKGLIQLNIGQYIQVIVSRGEHHLQLLHKDLFNFRSQHHIDLTGPEAYVKIWATLFSNKVRIVPELPENFASDFEPVQ